MQRSIPSDADGTLLATDFGDFCRSDCIQRPTTRFAALKLLI